MKTDGLLILAFPLEAGVIGGATLASITLVYQALQGDQSAFLQAAGAGAIGFGLCSGAALAWIASTVRDYFIPAPAPIIETQEVTTRMMVTVQAGEGGPQWQGTFLDLDLEPDRIREFAAQAAIDPDLSLARFSGTRRIFSRNEFERLRLALIAAGLARWNNPRAHQQGAALTAPGRAAMRAILRTGEGDPLPHHDDQTAIFGSFPGHGEQTQANARVDPDHW